MCSCCSWLNPQMERSGCIYGGRGWGNLHLSGSMWFKPRLSKAQLCIFSIFFPSRAQPVRTLFFLCCFSITHIFHFGKHHGQFLKLSINSQDSSINSQGGSHPETEHTRHKESQAPLKWVNWTPGDRPCCTEVWHFWSSFMNGEIHNISSFGMCKWNKFIGQSLSPPQLTKFLFYLQISYFNYTKYP